MGSGELARRVASESSLQGVRVTRQTARELARVEAETIGRLARVQSAAAVQHEKLVEIDRLTRTAMSGQAMLSRWAATLAAGDPFVADDLKFYADVAKLAKGEVIADTIDVLRREGRR